MATTISAIGRKEFKWSFSPENFSVFLGEDKHEADIQKISSGRYSILIDGKSYNGVVTRNEFKYSIIINGKIYRIEIKSSSKKMANLHGTTGGIDRLRLEVRAPMPGMVVRCEVQEGSKVEPGDGLLILEAMKMENEIRATKSGTIKKILVKDKQVVDKGELLITME